MSATADSVNLSWDKETAFGVIDTPTASVTLADVRFNSESFAQSVSESPSPEIRSDGQVAETIRTEVSAAGDIAYNLTYGSQDEFAEAALMATAWTSAVTDIASDTGISADNATQTFIGVATDFDNYDLYSWVKVSGFADSANNGFFKITGKAGDGSTITVGCGLVDIETEAAGATVSITQGAEITNERTKRHYSFEREYTDLSSVFQVFTGMTVNNWSQSITTGSAVTGTFSFIGKQCIPSGASISSNAHTAVNTKGSMSSGGGILGIFENCDPSACVLEFSFTAGTNQRNNMCVTEDGPADINPGKFAVSGKFSTYFNDNSITNLFVNGTETNFAGTIQDADGNTYIYDFPRVNITANPNAATGENSDITNEADWTATMDQTEGITMRVVRFAA